MKKVLFFEIKFLKFNDIDHFLAFIIFIKKS